MSRTAWERWIFCAVSFVLLFFAAMYRPTIYGNSPGEITRYLRREMADRGTGPTQLLAVEDDGPGIREKHLPNIFEMGYSTKFDEKTGNIYRGVGLCGVKNAVEEQFKGSISVESKEGKGTKFLIEIPAETLEER